MPIETEPTNYYLISYDSDGAERREGDVLLSDEAVRDVAEGPITDVVLLSHGWNGDLPAARSQYALWLQAMLDNEDDQRSLSGIRPGFRALIVGLHWPSKAWGDEEIGTASFSVEAAGADVTHSNTVDNLVNQYSVRLADTPTASAAIRTILEAALEDISPPVLPPEVSAAYRVLDAEANLPALGPTADPGADREKFDPEAVYDAVRIEEQFVPFGLSGVLGGLLAPLRTLTFWKMKQRALLFGQTGAAELFRRLKDAAPPDRGTRFHLVGHSFGCIVVSACVLGAPDGEATRADSVTLLQGALSLWSYCERIPVQPSHAGYFHRLVADRLVRGPVVVSMSEHDRAVGTFYPLGAGIARQVDFVPGQLPQYGGIGTFGARGPMPAVEDLAIADVSGDYEFRPGVVYNVDCSQVIALGDGASGAHSDICHPEVAHLVWSAIKSADSVAP